MQPDGIHLEREVVIGEDPIRVCEYSVLLYYRSTLSTPCPEPLLRFVHDDVQREW
jgi:hypothetical protein